MSLETAAAKYSANFGFGVPPEVSNASLSWTDLKDIQAWDPEAAPPLCAARATPTAPQHHPSSA